MQVAEGMYDTKVYLLAINNLENAKYLQIETVEKSLWEFRMQVG